MSNVVIIVGRITEIMEVKPNQVELVISITCNGNQNQDFIKRKVKVNVFNGIASKVMEYCALKDVIGIKGYADMDEDNHNILVAEKVSFLSSRSDNKED